jgi:hypothetical protein
MIRYVQIVSVIALANSLRPTYPYPLLRLDGLLVLLPPEVLEG